MESHSLDPQKLNYRLIDTNVAGHESWGQGSLNNFNSYCWHPTKDIIFYSKREIINKTKIDAHL